MLECGESAPRIRHLNRLQNVSFLFICLIWGGGHTQRCSGLISGQESLLVVPGSHLWCQGWNLGQMHVRQVPDLLNYFSGPTWAIFKRRGSFLKPLLAPERVKFYYDLFYFFGRKHLWCLFDTNSFILTKDQCSHTISLATMLHVSELLAVWPFSASPLKATSGFCSQHSTLLPLNSSAAVSLLSIWKGQLCNPWVSFRISLVRFCSRTAQGLSDYLLSPVRDQCPSVLILSLSVIGICSLGQRQT